MSSETSPTETVQKLFLRHAPALRGFILGLLPDRDSAGDVFQEVFLTATQRADDFRTDGNFSAWVRGIARNKILEHYRRSRAQPRLFDEELLEVLIECANDRDDVWEKRRTALTECIRRLAPRARQILEMRYADSPMPPPEIAQKLAWTVNAVHVALARARKFLQECTRRRLLEKEG